MSKEFDPSKYEIHVEKEPIYDGPHSTINAVNISVGNREVPLLRKKHIGYSADFMSGPKWHSLLQQKGYPVLPTWRYDERRGIDYITDLRRGGTHEVVDFCGHPDENKKIFISNSGDLENEAKILAAKLADDDIIIYEPNIYFDVELSTGVAKIIMGDLREIGYESPEVPQATWDQIYAHSMQIINSHISLLKEIMVDSKDKASI